MGTHHDGERKCVLGWAVSEQRDEAEWGPIRNGKLGLVAGAEGTHALCTHGHVAVAPHSTRRQQQRVDAGSHMFWDQVGNVVQTAKVWMQLHAVKGGQMVRRG